MEKQRDGDGVPWTGRRRSRTPTTGWSTSSGPTATTSAGPSATCRRTFINSFKGYAITLEQGKHAASRPHYITWYCPQSYLDSQQCKSQCINNGRYCAPDPEGDFEKWLRGQGRGPGEPAGAVRVQGGHGGNKPWVWVEECVTDFKKRCRMVDNNYNPACAKTAHGVPGL